MALKGGFKFFFFFAFSFCSFFLTCVLFVTSLPILSSGRMNGCDGLHEI